MQKRYRVEGMSCGGCVSSVEKAVKAAVGDAGVAVDLASGVLTIDGACAEEQIRAAVEGAGFGFAGSID